MQKRAVLTPLPIGFIRAGLYLTLLTPLVVWSKSLLPHISGKVLVFQTLVEVLALCALPALLASKEPAWRLAPAFLAVAASIGAALVSAAVGVDWNQSLWGLLDRQDGLILVLHLFAWMALGVWTIGVDRSPMRAIRTFVGLSFAVSVLVAVSVLWEAWAFLPPGSRGLLQLLSTPIRPGGVFGNPMMAGPYLLFHVFFGLFLANSAMKVARPVLRYGSVCLIAGSEILLVAAIAAGQTRGVIIGLGVALAGLGIYGAISRCFHPALRSAAAVLILLGLCGGVTLWSSRDSSYVKNNLLLSRLTQFSAEENISTKTRLMAWRSGLSSFLDHPVFGWGPRNVYYGLNRHYDPGQIQFSSELLRRDTTWFDRSHNAYIDGIAEGGLLGVAVFLVFSAAVMRALWRMPDRPLATCLAGALAGYAASNVVSFDGFGSLLPLFLTLAVISAVEPPIELRLPFGDKPSLQNKKPRKQAHAPSSRNWIQPALATVVAVLAPMGLYGNIEIARANRNAFLARSAFLQDASAGISYYEESFRHFSPYNAREKVLCAALIVNAAVTGVPSSRSFDAGGLVVQYAREAAADRPEDADVFIKLNEVYNSLALHADKGFANQAEAFGQRALELSPSRQEAAFTLGRTYIIKGEPARAVALNSRVVRSYPQFSTGHWFLGLSELANGNHEAAKREIRTALGMGYRFQTSKEADAVKELFGAAEYAELVKGR